MSSFGSILGTILGSSARLAVASFLLAAAPARAEVRYEVEPNGDRSRIKITMCFETAAGPIELQMPNWSPGDYELKLHGKKVADLHGRDAAGAPVAFDHAADNSWKGWAAKPGEVTVDYTVPAQFEAGALHFGGAGSYLYVVGRKEEPCHLRLVLPPDWKVAVGLDPAGESKIEYEAPDYDVLADNPVTAGDFIDLHYTSHGRPITIALRGALRAELEPEKIVKLLQKISDFEGDFFGALPFHKYVWHITLTSLEDGGGGLEHLTSTQVALAKGVGPVAARVCAHEFFHLWNVKRLRPTAFTPYDWTRENHTRLLWAMEGLTSTYEVLALRRAGLITPQRFLEIWAERITQLLRTPGRLRTSLAQASFDAWIKHYRPDESTANTTVSYYLKGSVVGFLLDLTLRRRTSGAGSLDDLVRALFEKHGRAPGLPEDGVERAAVDLASDPSLHEWFRRAVHSTEELPLEEALAGVGLKAVIAPAASADDKGGAEGDPAKAPETETRSRPWLGATLKEKGGALEVASVAEGSPAQAGGLASGDELVAVDGFRGDLKQRLSRAQPGQAARLSLFRMDELLEIPVRFAAAPRDTVTIVPAPEATPEQAAARERWLGARWPAE